MESDSRAGSPLSDEPTPITTHPDYETDAEMNLTCFILMIEILLKQVPRDYLLCTNYYNP